MSSHTVITAPLLRPDENAAAVENVVGTGPAVIICEHASLYIPDSLSGLGLPPDALDSHIAWDPGALELARRLSVALDAPLVFSTVSRLVYDCNRPLSARDAIPERSEAWDVPGNRSLSDAQRAAREAEIHRPFRRACAASIDAKRAAGAEPAIITVHSFTGVYNGATRDVELGLLHDADSRMADAMLPTAGRLTGLNVKRNAPYGPEDGVTHTLKIDAIAKGLPNIMIEVRNDLLRTTADVQSVGLGLEKALRIGLKAVDTNAQGAQ